MPNIDTLSIQFSAKGTKTATDNIKSMGTAIRSLATNINSIDASKLNAVANSMNQLKKSAPTKAQAERMTSFGTAVKDMATSFNSVNATKLNDFSKSMESIKKAVPTKGQAERISGFNSVLGGLSGAINGIDGTKLGTFASGMEVLKKSIPTKNQTERMSSFAVAVTELSNAIGAANIGEFSKDMSVLGGAVEQFKKSSVNSITNAVTAMQKMGQTATQTSTAINNATPKAAANIKMGDNRGTLNETKEIIASLEKVEVKATGAARILSKLGINVPTKQFKNLVNEAEKVRQKYESIRATLQKGLNTGAITPDSSEYKKRMADLDALRNKYDELILKQRELAQEGGAFKTNPAFSNISKSLEPFKAGVSSAANLIKNGLVGGLRLAQKAASSFKDKLKNVGTSLKNMVTGGNSATKMAKKFANEIFRVSKMLKLMVTRMALRKVIAEVGNGFKSLAIHSDEFNNSVSSMVNGAKRLGYSFAALVSPLINALAPAITFVINLLSKLLNAINQVLSALLGFSTWNKAKKFTDSWRDSLEDADGAAKKTAKDLKKTVLGFDELNQLQDNKDNSSKSGKGGLADMFDTLPIDKKWKDIADWLKKMWELGDFYDLGKKLGEKLRDWLESIPWESIRKTANKLGGALATLINGFVEVERLGYDIGMTIAQSVNTVFEFLNGFVHKLHWDSIGKFIAETFNGFFENIDWALIKDTVVTGMAGLAEALQNFIDTFHWDNISNFIINAVDTVVSGIKAFVDGVDWEDLGIKIGDQLNKTIEGIDWHDVGDTLGAVIMAAVDWAYGIIETFQPDEAIQALTDLLDGICDRVDFEKIGKTLGTALHKLIEVIKGFWGNEENRAKIKQAIEDFFKGIAESMTLDDFAFLLEVAIGAAGIFALANALKTLLIPAAGVGMSIAGAICAGIVTFFAGAEIGKMWGEYLFPDDKELYEYYSGFEGTLRMVKDLFVGIYDWLGMYFEAVWKWYCSLFDYYLEHFKQAFTALGTTVAALAFGDWSDLDSISKNISEVWKAYKQGGEELEKSKSKYEDAKAAIRAVVAPDYYMEGKSLESFVMGLNNELTRTQELSGSGAIKNLYSDMDGLSNSASVAAQLTKDLNDSTSTYSAQISDLLNPSISTSKELMNLLNSELEKSDQASQTYASALSQALAETDKINESTGSFASKLSESYDGLNEKGASFASKLSEIADESSKASKNIKDAKGTTDGLTQELGKASKNMDSLKGDTEKMSESVSKSSEIMNKLSSDLKNTKDSSKNYTDMKTTVERDSQAVQTAVNNVKFETAEKNMETYSNQAQQYYVQLKEALLGDTDEIDKTVNSIDFTDANNMFDEFTKNTSDTMEASVKSVQDGEKDITKSIKTISEGFTKDKWTFNGVADGLGETFRKAKDAIKREWNDIANTLNGEHQVGVEKVRIKLPKFARGGFPEDGLFYSNHNELVGKFSNGKTAVANNAQIVEGISSGVYSAVTRAMAQNNTSSRYISNTIVLDGETVARSITKAQEKQSMRYSPSY